MTDLTISTAERDLPLLIRFLIGLHLTGCLRVTQDRWTGKLFFDRGRLVGATFGAERGLRALAAILLGLPDGRCMFRQGAPAAEQNVDLSTPALVGELHELAQRQAQVARAVPSLRAVPRACTPSDPSYAPDAIAVPHSALLTLAAIDGRRSIEEVCGGRGLVRTLQDLALLVDLGLISVEESASLAPARQAIQTGFAFVRHLRAGAGRALRCAAQELRRGEHTLTAAIGQVPARVRVLAGADVTGHMLGGARRPASPDWLERQHPDETAGVEQAPAGYRELRWGQAQHRRRSRWVVPVLVLTLLGIGLILALCRSLGTVVQPSVAEHGAAAPTPLGTVSAAAAATVPPQPVPPATEATPPAQSAAPCNQKVRTILDERFASTRVSWPNNPHSTAWIDDRTYRAFVRHPGQFVAIGAPSLGGVRDVVVTATFRTIEVPPGGAYGLILRDQGPGPRDGINQTGKFYALQVNDRGEVNISRRDDDRWIDLVPWTRSEVIRPDTAVNELVALAIGSRLALMVNGTLVASESDEALEAGGVGVYVGGDHTEVALEKFLVEVPC